MPLGGAFKRALGIRVLSHAQPRDGEARRLFIIQHQKKKKNPNKSSFALPEELKPDARVMAVRREGGADADISRRGARELCVITRAEH